MSFEDNKNKKPSVGVKTQTPSIFDNKIKKPKLEDFEKQVSQIESKKLDYSNRAIDLIKKLNNVLNDKTLPQNKFQMHSSLEQEILNNFLTLLSEINNDQNQEESEGSIMGIGLIFNLLLSQRDKINLLEYEILNLQNKLNEK